MAGVRPSFDTDRFPTPFMYRLLLATISVYFLFRLLYFAFVIPLGIPPDELTHLELVNHFSDAVFMPETDLPAERAHLKLARYQPYLYYFIAGKVRSVNIFPVSELMFLRLLSIAFTWLTVFYGWKFISLFSRNPLVHLIFLVMLTNTIMFSFISASVSYDPLANLFAAMAIYYFTDIVLNRSAGSLPYFGLSLAMGCLTKATMLPLAFALVACLLLLEGKKLGRAKESIRGFWGSLRRIQKGWTLVALFAIVMNGFLYGNNWFQFGHLVPKASQVLSDDELLQHPALGRNAVYLGYLKGELTMEQALERAKRISNRPAASDTILLLRRAEWRTENGMEFEPISRVRYLKPWYELMLRSTYGIMAHETMFRSGGGLLPYTLAFVLTLCFIGLRAVHRKVPAIDFAFMGVLAFYVLILMQLKNYPAYLNFQEILVAVQGRYLFLLLLPAYGLVAKYLLSTASYRIRATMAAALVVLFVYGDFVFFVDEWN